MAKLNEQCKLCRREGEKLFLKGDRCFSTKCAIVKRNYKPGVHGPQGKPSKMTDYGKQLRAKQAAKRMYSLTEKQFSNYIAKAMKKKENTTDMILKFLESRLDNVVYRLGFTTSRASARQFVGHGFLNINGKKVDIPSYEVKPGDIISINTRKVNKKLVTEVSERIKTKETPIWIALDKEKMEAKVLGAPELQQGEKLFDIQNVIEFYSR